MVYFDTNYVNEEVEDYWSDIRDDEECWSDLMDQIKHYIWHKNFKQELIEAVYHPDRYRKMIEEYGEVWAEIHFD